MKKILSFLSIIGLLICHVHCYAAATYDATGTWITTGEVILRDPSGIEQNRHFRTKNFDIQQTSADPYDSFTLFYHSGHVYGDLYVVEGPMYGLPPFVPQDERPWGLRQSIVFPDRYYHFMFEEFYWAVEDGGDCLSGYLHCTASGWYKFIIGPGPWYFDPEFEDWTAELDFIGCRDSIIHVAFDIKPGSCPNPMNLNAKGVLSVAILGSYDLDVTQIDPASVRLAGVAPLRSNLEDVATPFEPFTGKEDCIEDCNDLGPNGYLDLTLKFKTQEVVAAIGEVEDGDCLVLTIMGNLKEEFDGTPIVGEDVVVILKKK